MAQHCVLHIFRGWHSDHECDNHSLPLFYSSFLRRRCSVVSALSSPMLFRCCWSISECVRSRLQPQTTHKPEQTSGNNYTLYVARRGFTVLVFVFVFVDTEWSHLHVCLICLVLWKNLLIFTAIKTHNYDDVYIQLGWCNFFFVISKFRHTDTTISHVLLNVCVWTRPRKLGMIKAMRALILLVKAYVSVGKFQSPQTLNDFPTISIVFDLRKFESTQLSQIEIVSLWGGIHSEFMDSKQPQEKERAKAKQSKTERNEIEKRNKNGKCSFVMCKWIWRSSEMHIQCGLVLR